MARRPQLAACPSHSRRHSPGPRQRILAIETRQTRRKLARARLLAIRSWRLILCVVALAVGYGRSAGVASRGRRILTRSGNRLKRIWRMEVRPGLVGDRATQPTEETEPVGLVSAWPARRRPASGRRGDRFSVARAGWSPLAARARLLAGQAELRRSRVRHAEEWLIAATRLDPRLVQAHRELIYIYARNFAAPS